MSSPWFLVLLKKWSFCIGDSYFMMNHIKSNSFYFISCLLVWCSLQLWLVVLNTQLLNSSGHPFHFQIFSYTFAFSTEYNLFYPIWTSSFLVPFRFVECSVKDHTRVILQSTNLHLTSYSFVQSENFFRKISKVRLFKLSLHFANPDTISYCKFEAYTFLKD